jgi:hypothetical protein
MNIHRAFAGLFAALFAAQAQAQHEISAYSLGGYSSFLYDAVGAEVSGGAGGSFGIGYTYSLRANWGISASVEMLFANAQA